MIVGIGIDVVDVGRFAAALCRRPRLAGRVFSPAERAHCGARGRGEAACLAARFAAKEAVMKALGAGLGAVAFREVEIVGGEGGRPLVRLQGRARALAKELGVRRLHVSLSHERELAVAQALAWGGQEGGAGR